MSHRWRHTGCSMQRAHISVSGGGGGASRDSPRILFSDIEERAMGMNGTPEYFSVNCFITHIRTDQRTLWYIACPNCKKKVQDHARPERIRSAVPAAGRAHTVG